MQQVTFELLCQKCLTDAGRKEICVENFKDVSKTVIWLPRNPYDCDFPKEAL